MNARGRLHLLITAGLALALTASAPAALVTWDNGGSGDNWTTAGNWNPDGEPDPTQDSVLFTTGVTNVVTISGNGTNVNLASGQTFTLDADTRIKFSHASQLTFDDVDQLQGSGLLTLAYSKWGPNGTVISAAQPNFSGGFALQNSSNRHLRLTASVADAMGTGAATGTGRSQFNYTWGAQSIVGGVTAGITVGGDAVINLQGTVGDPTTLRERFTVNNRGILAGNATQLGYLTRVSSFSASPTGAEVVLADGAVIVATDYDSTPDVANLGTDADLLYGITGTLNNAGFTLNVGAGTPWKGLSTEANRNQSDTGWSEDRLGKGTVVIDDGGGTFTELLLNAPGESYSNPRVGHLVLGGGSDAPAFTRAAGSGPVGLRTELGYVHVNSPNLDLSGIDSWTIENGARLVLDYALPGDDTNLADLIGLVLESGASVELTGEDTYVNALTLGGVSYDPGTYDNTTDGAYIKGTGSITVIPEPGTLGLIALGGLGVILRRRRA